LRSLSSPSSVSYLAFNSPISAELDGPDAPPCFFDSSPFGFESEGYLEMEDVVL